MNQPHHTIPTATDRDEVTALYSHFWIHSRHSLAVFSLGLTQETVGILGPSPPPPPVPLPPTQDQGPVKTQPLRTFCLPSASDIRKESGPSCELYCYIGFIIKYNFRILLVKNFQLNSIITRTHTNLSNCAVCSLSAVFKLFVAALVRNIKTLRRVFLSHFTLTRSPAVSSLW